MFRKIWLKRKVVSDENFSLHLPSERKGIIYEEGDNIYHLEVERGGLNSPTWIVYGKSTTRVLPSGELQPVAESERLRINQRVRDALNFLGESFVMD